MNIEKPEYLQTSDMLDFKSPHIESLVAKQGWLREADKDKRISSIYTYVRDEIKFGYNANDTLSASSVLADGYGQCNTKGTLFMALLRSVGIPCRLHGFTIHKKLQKGAIPSLLYILAPRNIIHSWVEVYHNDKWINLEGIIIDKQYLHAIQDKFKTIHGYFLGYGIATHCLSDPQIEWNGNDTYIQKEGIVDDYGRFNTPDEFYKNHGGNLTGIKKWLFSHIIRHYVNRHVDVIRRKHSCSVH